MRSDRQGFTIVELLVVIAIISILAGAITMGVNGMFYKSRLGRAKAIQAMLQSGLETYYASTGYWPKPIQSAPVDVDSVLLSAEDADECFREIVKVSVGSNAKPVLDPSGLFVAKDIDDYGCSDIHRAWNEALKLGIVSSGSHKCSGNCRRGRDFKEATKKGSKDRIGISSMNFGYQGPNNGRFCRFRLYYYPKSDTVRVLLQPANSYYSNKYRNGFIDD
jgi:prepilin-type N-terminal cleavage/methylation domain-containing protein